MSHFVLMLPKDDRTVPNALAAYEEVRYTALTYVGFKDIGLPFAMCDADVWAFTIGSALFEGRFAGNLLKQQIRSLVQMRGVSE